ncbi:hypothetical protein SAMN04488034_10147 [Salinimicrobium catena]|uniref:Uncharacterized protein n=1 Tax=Salinimicrobium catena TaxID=390640 RepID=A0A1H5H0B2_9FLAO|nr:hypothetical protein [Salinimicrobium catena]SDK66923.1 hypothetical protein SAMN04488140_10147 [Salinimicrobium catena]SEE21387.1 hypothetical protein SAMN04488034_10147 [Salinimicrobium catena]
MKQEEITYLLQNPAAVTLDQTAALKEVLQEYPYFQAARAVRLKGLKNSNSLHYNKALKITAAYTTDRGVFFDLITSEEFNQNQIAEQIRKHEEQEKELSEKEEENLTLDKALKMKIRESEQVFDPDLFRKQEKTEKEEARLQIGRPLDFSKEENHSFSEWLKLSTATPVKRDEEPSEEKDDDFKSRKFDLINKFIAKNPKIAPVKSSKKANIAEENLISPEALMTETLARVYLEQKNYKKAIQAYKILILKNPEKSGFFADQIRAIEKLQENNS